MNVESFSENCTSECLFSRCTITELWYRCTVQYINIVYKDFVQKRSQKFNNDALVYAYLSGFFLCNFFCITLVIRKGARHFIFTAWLGANRKSNRYWRVNVKLEHILSSLFKDIIEYFVTFHRIFSSISREIVSRFGRHFYEEFFLPMNIFEEKKTREKKVTKWKKWEK